MTLCPIAIVAGCQKCPAFKVCPLKGVIGDQPAARRRAAQAGGEDVAAQEGLTTTRQPFGRRPLAAGGQRARPQSSPCLSASDVNESA